MNNESDVTDAVKKKIQKIVQDEKADARAWVSNALNKELLYDGSINDEVKPFLADGKSQKN